MRRKGSLGPYWYMHYHYECPVCGRITEERVRQYGEKPKSALDRHHYIMDYDHCNEEVL